MSKSLIVRGDVVVSVDGLSAAYVENHADWDGSHCTSKSALFVRDNAGKFKLRLAETQGVGGWGDVTKLIRWSPQAKTLLVERFSWKWETSGFESRDILLLNVQTGPMMRLVPTQHLTSNQDCVHVDSQGFTDKGEVVVRISSPQGKQRSTGDCGRNIGTFHYNSEADTWHPAEK